MLCSVKGLEKNIWCLCSTEIQSCTANSFGQRQIIYVCVPQGNNGAEKFQFPQECIAEEKAGEKEAAGDELPTKLNMEKFSRSFCRPQQAP
jgi:hypothetical protein